MTLGIPTRGLALRSAPSVSSARHAPAPPLKDRVGGYILTSTRCHPSTFYLLPSPTSTKKTCVTPLLPIKIGEEERTPTPSTSTHRPCHGSTDQGKLLLALVGPESHDFNSQVVMGVTSGKQKGTFDAVADSGVLLATERGSTRPEPRPPWSLPLPPHLPLWMLQVLL